MAKGNGNALIVKYGTNLLNNSFEPPLGAHKCNGGDYFGMEHTQGPVLSQKHHIRVSK